MFRVYDIEKKCWIKDNVYLGQDGVLYLINKSIFGLSRLPLVLDSERYICHKAIDLLDRNQNRVFEGDYIKARVADDRTVIGLVAFAQELSSYIIFCIDCDEYYTLGSEVTEYIEVIGNVFDGYKEDEEDGQQTLQESEV